MFSLIANTLNTLATQQTATDFQRVNYAHFSEVLMNFGSHKIANKGKKTFVYDANNRMLAVVKAATLDTFGQVSAPEYYIRAA